MKKNILGLFGALALAASLPVAATQSAPIEQRQTSNKETIVLNNKIRPSVTIKNDIGGFSGERNPFKNYAKGYHNQRQFRKWMRQVPQLRNKYSKK